MSLWKRFTLIFKAKASKALDKAEDPRETLDYSYNKQLELLQQVRRGVADVATSRKRIELQMNTQTAQADKLTEQAQKALSMGREDLAREALTRKAAVNTQLAELKTQYDHLAAEEEKLTAAAQRLQTKVEAFRTQKETIKATYTAAQAQTKINDAVAGLGGEFGDVGLAIQRAQDKTQEMQARAGAVDELLASGALDDAFGNKGDDLDRQLNALSAGADIDAELAALKSGGQGTPAPALGVGHTAAGNTGSTISYQKNVVDAEIVEG